MNEERMTICSRHFMPYVDGMPWRDKGMPAHEEIVMLRDGSEVRHVGGLDRKGVHAAVAIAPDATAVANPAFDVTPARFITGIVTERGVCAPGELHTLFEEAK